MFTCEITESYVKRAYHEDKFDYVLQNMLLIEINNILKSFSVPKFLFH